MDRADLDEATINDSLGVLLKYQDDMQRVQGALGARSGATGAFNALIQDSFLNPTSPLLFLMQAPGTRLDRHERTR